MNSVYPKQFIPQNYLVEEILLGTMILYPNLSIHIKDTIKEDFFFLESHQIIYINLLENTNKRYNIMYLLYALQSKRLLKKIGGLRKVINVMRQSQIFINSSQISNYITKLVKILSFNYIKRLIVQYGYHIAKLGYISTLENEYLYKKIIFYFKFIEGEIIKNKNNNQNIVSLRELISIKLLKLKYPLIYKNNPERTNQNRIQFGLKNLDHITKGLPCGNLIVIAGRPSIGKTSFAIKIAYNTFFYQQANICMFSLEMSTKEILNKFLCASCEININKNNIMQLSTKNWKDIILICKKLIKNNIYINDKKNVNIEYIEHTTENLKKKQSLSLIIIDYLQLIESLINDNKKPNRSQELGYITRKLKLLAQLLKLPIIVLSQLNRNIEIRSNKEPILSDLKESGCIKYNNNIKLSIPNKYLNISSIKLLQVNSLAFNSSNSNIWQVNQSKSTQKHKQIKDIYLSIKIIIILAMNKSKLQLTSKHKYLSQESWKKVYLSTRYCKVNYQMSHDKHTNIITKQYIREIFVNKESKTYDINFNDTFHFLSKQIILHNSIEQDADIIIMLNNKEQQENQHKEKIIDIKVSKNRNGYTGYSEVLFVPEKMKFTEFTVST
uniref:DNA 5'-3' helicase n=1 Tax=Palisada sp. TaxID=1955416 RepID=A0A1Z1MRR2_9FLOR|nr:Replication helicase subunit [Palisada sp.]